MRQPLPYSPESILFQLRTLRVALAGCSTRRWSLPALASRPLTVGWPGTLTWNVAVVPVPRLKVSLTVSLPCPTSILRCPPPTPPSPPSPGARLPPAHTPPPLPPPPLPAPPP